MPLNHHELRCDVLVAGGGPAGVPCALAAARRGAKVILVQDRSVLGGNASSEVRMHIVGADGGRGGADLETETREGGIIEEIRLDTCVQNPQRSPSILDLILYDKCRIEPNLTLMLNTAVVSANTQDGRIVSAVAERQSTEDRFTIHAKVFIDCTGDGRLGAEAGALFRVGREGQAEFNETLAQPEADFKSLGSTLLFVARKHDKPMPFYAPSWVRKFTEEDLRLRPHASAGIDKGPEYGYWWAEWGGCLNTIKDNELIRDELMAIMLGVWDHIKNSGDHGAENWALEWFSFLPGKRESRRFVGQHILSESDVMGSAYAPDAIAYGGWPIDTHPPEGIDRGDLQPCNQHRVPHLFDIPLRCCVSKNVSNLMFAGRNISATHIAFASTRVMATCAVMGQGVGTAAAYAVRNDLPVAGLAGDEQAIQAIQQQLIEDDAFLINVPNQHPGDLARRARLRASSEQAGGEAAQVVSGQTRSVHGERGARPERARPGAHRWMSDPAQQLPAWIELSWEQAFVPGQVRLVFDTGMSRHLTLSHSDAYAARMHWGQPAPQTVRDYRIEGRLAGQDQWQTLTQVTGNYQRLRVHRFEQAPQVDAIRVVVQATNGLDHARIFEVRVYGRE